MTKRFIVLTVLTLLMSIELSAQKNPVSQNIFITEAIEIDADLKDWGDSLKNYNPVTKLNYEIGNDKQNLYLAVKTADQATIRKILSFGFSFSVNTEGKKKLGPTVTFPVIDHIAVRRALSENKTAVQKGNESKINNVVLSKIKGIQVTGFKSLLDGDIALKNEYGVQAAATIDEQNSFVMELTIPLRLLELSADSKNVLAYNLKANGLQRTVIQQSPMRGLGRYGGYGYWNYGYGERETYKSTVSESVQFWTLYTWLYPNSK